ncbi:helix-turn-helix domain-containing protein [Pelagibacterium luteolum]|uniref:Helix-turn-helix domain-containing protein n=1 Tax=Pelagibacterium luteolum TaxID=440168 RepID=A0A1G7YHF0_9HYPH|nr:Helix-turn-helix domain-containing protein [Pelagibacterium luteolum]
MDLLHSRPTERISFSSPLVQSQGFTPVPGQISTAINILDEALGRLPYNPDYFRRAFKERIGYTPSKFVEFKRLEQAMNILAAGHSVKETAAMTGYPDVYYFSRQFKRYMGTSPSAYRLLSRAKESGQFIDGVFHRPVAGV